MKISTGQRVHMTGNHFISEKIKLFSSYLAETKVITPKQLEIGIGSQKQNNWLMGYHAIRKGFMLENNLMSLMPELKHQNSQFGELCMANGLLTCGQVGELLRLQAFNHNYLGLSLVNSGYLNINDLRNHLEKFKNILIRKIDFGKNKDIEPDLNSQLISEIFHTIRCYFYNQGYVTEVASISSEFNPNLQHSHFAVELQPRNRIKHFIGLSLSKNIIFDIAAKKQQEFSVPFRPYEFDEVFGQILFNLNYSICRMLKKSGRNFKHGPVQYSLPKYKNCITLRCKSNYDHLDISILI